MMWLIVFVILLNIDSELHTYDVHGTDAEMRYIDLLYSIDGL